MTLSEAQKIAIIVATAEGGCKGCIAEAVIDLNRQFLAFNWSVTEPKGKATCATIDVIEKLRGTPKPAVKRYHC